MNKYSVMLLLQWQHAPNNNGRAKKLRLKKEAEAAAEAAAQPEALTPPASQEPPAQSVCVPLHADRHLLQWPQAVAPRQPTELIDHSQAASNVNASEQTAEVMNPTNAASRQTAEHSDYAQAAVNTEPSHEVAQQAVTIAEQTTDQVAQQPLQPGPSKPSGHEDAVQQARTETATPATAAANQAMQSQCPEGTEHRKVLGHRFAGLSKPSFILPDADDPQNRSQQFPAVPAAHTASPESCARPLTYISGAHAVQPEPPPHHSPVGHQSAAHSSPYPFVVNGAHSHSTATHTTGTTPMELVMERFPGPARGPSPEPAVAQDRRLAEPFPERSSAEPKPCAPVNAFSQWVAVQDPATAAKQAEADPELLHAKPSMEQRLEGGASAAGPLPQPATDFRLDTGGTVNTCNPIH